MHTEGRQGKCDLTVFLLKRYAHAVGAQGCRLYIFVGLNTYFNSVKLRKIGEQTYVSAIYGRRIKNVNSDKSLLLIFSYTDPTAGRKIFGYNFFVVYLLYSELDIIFKNIVLPCYEF